MEGMISMEYSKVAQVLIEDMFQVKPGEVVAITGDTGSDRRFAGTLASMTEKRGAKPLILWTSKASHDGQAGISDWPAKALTAALCKVDVWIELQSTIILYSHIWETVMAKNKKIRYLIIGDSSIQSLMRTFVGFDIKTLDIFLNRVKDITMKSKTVRITSENGTDVSYKTNLDYAFDIDSGDYSKPKFGTAPGYINIVPKKGSMYGKIVFDLLMNADVYDTENHIEFMMENGKIVDIIGGGEAEKFKAYLASFNDENMYKISHNMFGFNPGVRQLCGEIVEDERIWGGVDFGFGHTSPLDMPPNGQPAKSHFDGVVGKVSIYLDGTPLVENGVVSHPELETLSKAILNH